MEELINKYGWTAIEMISGMLALLLFVGIYSNAGITDSGVMQTAGQPVTAEEVYTDPDVPYVTSDAFVISNVILDYGSDFDWKDHVTVTSSNGLDLRSYITVTYPRNINESNLTQTYGSHELTFSLNWNSYHLVRKAVFYVRGDKQ